MKCGPCRRPDMARRRLDWGCDGETRNPVLSLRCPVCRGEQRHDCPHCDARGLWHLRRCPFAVVPREYHDFMAAFVLWRDGMAPRIGGMNDQSAWFVAAARHVGNVIAEAEHEDREDQRRSARG